MIAIAERINGMFKDVKKAIKNRDASIIQDLARKQTAAGAKFLDCNVGTAAADQLSTMQWLVESIQSAVDTPIALDSQKIEVIKAGLEVCKSEVMINSCKADDDQLDLYMPLAVEHNASLVALTITADGVPQDIDTRVMIAANIAAKAMEHGLPMEKLFIDPIILPVNCDQKQPEYLLEVMRQIKLISDPAPHMTVGLSNVSQGTSQRELINRTFLVMAMGAGLDSAIFDVLDTEIMDAAITADMLKDKMIYSDSYLKAARM